MRKLRRSGLAVVSAACLAVALTAPVAAAPNLTVTCRETSTGKLIYPIMINSDAYASAIFPNLDRNGFLTAGSGCTT